MPTPRSWLVLVPALGAVACGMAGPEVGEGPPARLDLLEASASTGLVGNVVPTPRVRVRNAAGQVLPGVTVRFRAEGGGVLARAEAESDGAGVASPGGWRLGPDPGPQRLVAEVEGLQAQHTVTAEPLPPQEFRIEIVWETVGRSAGQPALAAAEALVEAAVRRWETLVLGDLPDMRIQGTPAGCPGLLLHQGRNVDDLLIFVVIGPTAQGVLADTDVCLRRPGSGLPLVARITVNAQAAEASSGVTRAMLHEIAHALGIGTAWPSALVRERDGDLRFLGRSAESAFHLALGQEAGPAARGVPLEMGGGASQARGHWRESVLDRELLTPLNNSSLTSPVEQPLSAITIAALRDLGYVVNDAAADPFPAAPAASPVRPVGGGGPPRYISIRP